MTVDAIYQFCLKLIRKNQSGSLSASDFNSFWSAEQCAYMEDMLGHFQRGANGKTGANTGLVLNQQTITKLSPFIKPASITVTAGNGPKPPDFQYELLLRVNGHGVTHLNHGQIPSVNDSVIDMPSSANDTYYCVEYEDYYYFLPSSVTAAALDYISTPVDVAWAYTFDGEGRQEYDASASIDPQWMDADSREITKRMLKSIGVALSSKDFENFGESVIEKAN